MITSDIFIPGRLGSDTDRLSSASTGAILTNCHLQGRLATIHRTLREYPEYGEGARRFVRGIEYQSLFDSDWQIMLQVSFLIGSRNPARHPDVDDIGKALKNALAFPSPELEVPGVVHGDLLYTMGVDDRQFTHFTIGFTLFGVPPQSGALFEPAPAAVQGDLTIIRFSALPPPHLALTLSL